MQYRQLGNASLPISAIGFGCMSLPAEREQAIRLLRTAVEQGINFFDTADLYDKGRNEAVVGEALRQGRKNLVLATKVGNVWRPDGSGWDWNPTKAYILKAAEDSLRRLQTDYIDLYQLHGGTIDDPMEETIEAFEQLQRQGKIRCYGISSIRPNVICEWVRRAHLSSVMMQYSLLDRRPEETVLTLLESHGVGVLARGSLAQGLLAGKPAKPYLGHSAAAVERLVKEAEMIAGDIPSSQLAVGFVLRRAAVASVVVGIRTEAQLVEAIAAAALPRLSPDQWLALEEKLPRNSYAEHR